MLEAIALDVLLFLILLLLIPIGMYRGGLREVCSSAGLLLGLLVASQWSDRWGTWLADQTGIDAGISRFAVAVGTIVVFTGVIGYGGATSFAYTPGAGGRMYGGLLSLLNGIVFLGAVIQFVATDLHDGVYPDLIRSSYLARALSVGFDWVILAVSLAALLATLFGMIVRERDTDQVMVDIAREAPRARRAAPAPAQATEPVTIEPAAAPDPGEVLANTATVKIREVRHWEEPTPPTLQDLRSGWSRTWPSDVTKEPAKPSWTPREPRAPQAPGKAPATPDETVIRDWLADDQSRGERKRRPGSDE